MIDIILIINVLVLVMPPKRIYIVGFIYVFEIFSNRFNFYFLLFIIQIYSIVSLPRNNELEKIN